MYSDDRLTKLIGKEVVLNLNNSDHIEMIQSWYKNLPEESKIKLSKMVIYGEIINPQ